MSEHPRVQAKRAIALHVANHLGDLLARYEEVEATDRSLSESEAAHMKTAIRDLVREMRGRARGPR